jgi:hypothetical protein
MLSSPQRLDLTSGLLTFGLIVTYISNGAEIRIEPIFI